MNLINVFESKPFQDVGTFNAIFKATPILGYPSNAEVEIKELVTGKERRVLVNGDTLYIDLTQKTPLSERTISRAKKKESKVRKIATAQNKLLPDIYRRLSSAEFLIYHALKELGEAYGVSQLARNISLSRQTITACLPRLISLGFVKTEKVTFEGKTILRIVIDNTKENN